MLLTWQTIIVFLLSHKNRINCLAKVVALSYPGIKNCVLLRHAKYFGFAWFKKNCQKTSRFGPLVILITIHML